MAATMNTAWPELLMPSNLTAEHGDDGNRIAMATESIQQVAYLCTKLLNDRALLFANSAQFDAALRDAAAIDVIIPGSALGYLCTGNVYCQQGRYAAAISIYDQGLEARSESDPYYQQLQQHRLTAVTNNSKRIDFITQLPLDIVITNILPRVQNWFCSGGEETPEYLYVSRAWQERIVQQPEGLDYHFGLEKATFKTGHDLLVRFAPYVQKLSGVVYDHAKLEDLFTRGYFSNVKEVEIFCDSTTLRVPLLNGLQMISGSLTHLEIVGREHDLHIGDILESCPNLVSLITEDVDIVIPALPFLPYPKIKHLALHDVPEFGTDFDEMDDLLRRFPSLLSFEITPMPESALLTILHEHCPYLQVLYYGIRHYHSSDNFIDVHPPHRKGITFARLGGGYVENTFIQDDLIHFLYLHRDSLEEIVFDGDIEDHGVDALWRLQNGRVVQQREYSIPLSPESDPARTEASFVRLARINISDHPSSSLDIIAWLISNAPNLKDITINESSFLPDVANAMINLKQLSKLMINQHSRGDNYDGIVRFLEYHSGIGEESTLKELTIITGTMTPEATWIPLIAKLHCLKNLELHASSIPADCFWAMNAIGRGCKALEELTLGMPACDIGYGIIESFAQHSNLKCLRIGSDLIPNSSLILLLLCPPLERLYLRCNPPENIMKVMRMAGSKVVINKG